MEQYVKDIQNGIIPDNKFTEDGYKINNFDNFYKARDVVTSSGLWVRINKNYFSASKEQFMNLIGMQL